MRYLFPFFLIMPIIEIYMLLKASGVIGPGWTILAVVATAVIGAYLVKAQGFMTLNSVQHKMAQGQMPAMEVAEGVAILVAGALLLTPGFVTDAFGFACLLPPLRRAMISRIFKRGVIQVQTSSGFGAQPQAGAYDEKNNDVRPIEGEYRDLDK